VSGVVAVEGLVKRFGETVAVDGISFEVGRHEFFSLLGPSGCGKTTTLRCVAGLETAEAGRIRIGEHRVFDADRHLDVPTNKRAIGMVFQSYAVWPHMTVFENIGYPLRVRGVGRREIRERVERVLAILGMPDLEHRLPSQLSGGQQQRVALGRALAVEPTVLLLDEPLSNLDAKLREQMRAELKQVQR
jgi:ABC-type sugar transport system ATPase subunit